MTINSGTLVTAPIRPYDSADTYPVVEDDYLYGGYRVVGSVAARDAIPADRRREGMRVRVAPTGVEYILGSDLTTWTATSETLSDTYNQGGTGAVTRTVTSRLRDIVSVKDFGASGDGVTDDTSAIEAAISYISKTTDKNFTLLFPPGEYITSSVILLPFGVGDYGRRNNILISGYGATLIGSGSSDTDHDCFESAYWNAGVATTTIGTPAEANLAYGVVITGFNFKDYRRCFYLQNWNQGCALRDLYAENCQAAIDAARCFYTSFDNFLSIGAPTADTKPNFKFTAFANIMPIRSLKSADHATCFEISQADGLRLSDCGLEDCTDGIVFSGECSQVSLDNMYIEGCSNSGIKFDSVVRSLTLSNSFINLSAVELFASTLSNAQYASVALLNNRYESGAFTIPDNIYVTSINQPNNNASFTVTANKSKVVDLTPQLLVDTSALGNAGQVRFSNWGSTDIVNPGFYKGKFGDTRLNSSNRLNYGTYQNNNGAGELQIDTEIEYTKNMMAEMLLEYSHSGGTYRRKLLILNNVDNTEVTTSYIYDFDNTGFIWKDPATTLVAEDDGAGLLRIRVIQHTSHALINASVRLI